MDSAMPPAAATARRLLLPDFCAPLAVLAVLVIVTLSALLLAIADAGFGPDFWSSLARKLLFLVWTGLLGAALLCGVRRHVAALSAASGATLVLALVAVLIAAISGISFWVLASPVMNPSNMLGLPPEEQWLFLARNLALGLIISALALRYFYVTQQWRLNVEAQAHMRINALQARIRPHFLYNSMNTIASLTRSDPALAEGTVLDLADLFRATLGEPRNLVTLEQELELTRSYQRIEQQRLGDRLRVRWDVQHLPPRLLVPSLSLQPLLENAIGHGIEQLAAGGEVAVEGQAADGLLVLTVRNPLPPEGSRRHAGDSQRHGIALENIRERLVLLFGARASVQAGRAGDEFIVQLRFPATESPPGAAP
jgi:two-component system, LytTR family, sensor histidine kinase AlgZ